MKDFLFIYVKSKLIVIASTEKMARSYKIVLLGIFCEPNRKIKMKDQFEATRLHWILRCLSELKILLLSSFLYQHLFVQKCTLFFTNNYGLGSGL